MKCTCSKTHRPPVVPFLLSVVLASGCAGGADSTSGADNDTADVGPGASTDVAARWDLGLPESDVTRCTTPDPMVDTDGDGLLDVVEDRNLDCVVDADETDPTLADTDGDGLTDREEDTDGNGRVDLERGEFDPRTADTDGDSVLDGAEATADVCVASKWTPRLGRTTRFASGRTLLLDEGWRVVSTLANADALVVSAADEKSTALFMAVPAGSGEAVAAEIQRAIIAGEFAGQTLFTHTEPGENSRIMEAELATGDTALATVLRALVPDWVEGADAIEPPAEPSGERNSQEGVTAVHLDLRRATDGVDVDRLSLSLTVDPNLADSWGGIAGASRIAPTIAATPRVMCSEQLPEPVEATDVMVVADTRSAARDLIADTLDALDRVDALQRALLVPADGHQEVDVTGLLGFDSGTFSELLGATSDWIEDSDDQRFWMNAATAIGWYRVQNPDAPLLVVMIASSEDAEFREGQTGGLDGDAMLPPLPAGEARDALTRYYLDVLRGAGVSWVGISPSASGAPGRCIEEPQPGDLSGFSFEQVAALSAGTWFNACSPDYVGPLQRFMRSRSAQWSRVSLGLDAIGMTAQLSAGVGTDGLETEVLDGLGVSGQVALRGVAPDSPVAVAYLFWEP